MQPKTFDRVPKVRVYELEERCLMGRNRFILSIQQFVNESESETRFRDLHRKGMEERAGHVSFKKRFKEAIPLSH